MTYGLTSASKNMTLNQLKKIKADNFVGSNGKDYCPFELEARIQEIEMRQAMNFVSSCKNIEKKSAHTAQVNDFLAKPKSTKLEFKIQNNKPMFPLNMALEMAG